MKDKRGRPCSCYIYIKNLNTKEHSGNPTEVRKNK